MKICYSSYFLLLKAIIESEHVIIEYVICRVVDVSFLSHPSMFLKEILYLVESVEVSCEVHRLTSLNSARMFECPRLHYRSFIGSLTADLAVIVASE